MNRNPSAAGPIVIDAGHGGRLAAGRSTPLGVRGPAGTLEKDVTLDLARRVAALFGGRAVLTRHDDRNVTLGGRAQVAARHDAAVFLSLHANGGAPGRRGGEAFVHGRAGRSSRILASMLSRRLARFGGAGRGVEPGDFAVLTPERLPAHAAACLLEVDYLSDREGERHLRDPRRLDDLARAIAGGVDDYLAAGRYGDGAGDAPEPQRADPARVAERLLLHYLGPYLTRLSDEAKRRLVDAWRESPGGVIAAAGIVGSAGIAYLVGTESALPALPAIPLDALGGIFRGAELRLQLSGPVTDPTSFQFSVTFHERPAPRRARDVAPDGEYIDDLLADGNKPEDIAARVDGPEFETEVPGEGPGSDIALYLGEFIRTLANALLREVADEPVRPWIDLGQLPPLPGDFGRGLTRIIDELVTALPDRFGSLEQVSFITRVGHDVRWIPVIPSARRVAAEGQALSARTGRAWGRRYGDAVQCLLEVTQPASLPTYRSHPSSFRMSNNHSATGRVLFDEDTVTFQLENVAAQDVGVRIVMSDDEHNGVLCETSIELHGTGASYLRFSGFGVRADQVSPRNSVAYEITLTNLQREREGVEIYVDIYV